MMRTNMMTACCLLGLAAAGCVPTKADVVERETDPRTPVEVMVVSTGKLVEKGDYYGSLEPAAAVMISAEVGGRVGNITVDEGSIVEPGALLVTLDDEPYRLAEAQARQQVATAEVRIAQLEAAIEVERTTLDAGVAQAAAVLDAAQARLRLVEKGARPEEKKQAKAGRDAARAALDNARVELARAETLFQDGAATQQMLDGARTQVESTEARHEQAVQIYRIAVKGARTEDKEQARAAVKQAEAALARARATVKQLVVREKELEAARLGLETAHLGVEQATYSRSKVTVKSPLAVPATVAMRAVDAGEMVAPGTRLVELLDLSSVKLQLLIPSRDVRHLRVGDSIPLHCVGDAPGIQRTGKVRYVSVKANAQNTTFPVELVVTNEDGALRAGQICEAFPELAIHNKVLVPRSAVLDTEEGKVAMVVQEGVAREVPVTLEAVRAGTAAVALGLEPGAELIVVGERMVRDGDEVNVVKRHDPITLAETE